MPICKTLNCVATSLAFALTSSKTVCFVISVSFRHKCIPDDYNEFNRGNNINIIPDSRDRMENINFNGQIRNAIITKEKELNRETYRNNAIKYIYTAIC